MPPVTAPRLSDPLLAPQEALVGVTVMAVGRQICIAIVLEPLIDLPQASVKLHVSVNTPPLHGV